MGLFERFHEGPVIIAEIGAKYAELPVLEASVRAAHEAGADLVKFQTYRAETLATPGCTFTLEDGSVVSQYDFFKKYELSAEDHCRIDECCRNVGIGWLSTPSHPEDVALLERFDPIAYKTGSDDLTNLPFLRCVAATGRPIIVSTGMSTLAEVESAVEAVRSAGNRELVLLHCVTSYPSAIEAANLRAIETLARAFGLPVGLSDHTTDELTSVLATALGAAVIEKHFVLDHALGLPDDQVALDPAELRQLCKRVRLVPKALGDGVKRPQPSEHKWRDNARKSLHAARAIRAGERIDGDALAVRRPSGGIAPEHLENVIGRSARQEIAAGAAISWTMV